MLFVEGYCEAALFRHLSNHVFRNPQFWKYVNYECNIFFQNVQNSILILKMQKKVVQIIFVIGNECVNKQSYNFAYQ